MVRLPGICEGGGPTTVLAHVRLAGISGAGLKAADALGAWACYRCHEATERLKKDDTIQRAFLEGVIRTQATLIKDDILRW